jgi:hypothetical protein
VGRGRQGSRFFIVVTPPADDISFFPQSFSAASKEESLASGSNQDSSSSTSSVSSTFYRYQPPVRRLAPLNGKKQMDNFLRMLDYPNVPYWYRFKAPFEQPEKPQHRAALKLGPIADHRLSLPGLRSLDPDGALNGVLDIIESEEATKKLLKANYRDHLSVKRVSYNMEHCAVPLQKVGVAEALPPGASIHHSLTAFLVPKKDGTGRFVIDASSLSKVFETPAKMGIEALHLMIRRILRWKTARTYDAVSMFYQFAINKFLSSFFVFLLGGKRGKYHVAMRLLVLCMGWNWAPLIAHTSSKVICGPTESVPFVDNFACEGSDANVAALLSRFKKADLLVRREDTEDWDAPSTTDFEHIGIHYDLKLHRFGLSEKTRSQAAKVARTLEEFAWRAEPLTATDLFVAIGYIIYSSFVVGEPLALHDAVIALAKWVARLAYNNWQRPIFVPDHILHSLWARLRYFATQRWYKERDLPSPEASECLEMWTDASDLCAGIVMAQNHGASPGILEVTSRRFAKSLAEAHIYVKESVAFHQGFMELHLPKYQPYRLLRSYLDNMALFFGVRKGRSSVDLVNDVIRAVYYDEKGGRVFEVGWVNTHCMLADFPSREKDLPDLPLPRCEDQRCAACFPHNLVQPRWMTFVAATSSHTLPYEEHQLPPWPGLTSSLLAATEKETKRSEGTCESGTTNSGSQHLPQDLADRPSQPQLYH